MGGTTTPPGSRMSIISDLGGRITPRVWPAVDAYLAIARKYEIDPVQLAIAWTLTRSFMASSIIGAKSLDQLRTVLGAAEIKLSDAILADIDLAHRAHPIGDQTAARLKQLPEKDSAMTDSDLFQLDPRLAATSIAVGVAPSKCGW